MPTGTHFLHFITLDNGSARMITAYHAPPGETMIRGAVLTFANPRGRELYPAVAPVMMVRQDAHPALGGLTGRVPRSDPRVAPHLKALDEITLPVALVRI
ncbi:MAG: hypothetical protein R3D33_08740 [Hyphomicrobiaceae bacterium]